MSLYTGTFVSIYWDNCLYILGQLSTYRKDGYEPRGNACRNVGKTLESFLHLPESRSVGRSETEHPAFRVDYRQAADSPLRHRGLCCRSVRFVHLCVELFILTAEPASLFDHPHGKAPASALLTGASLSVFRALPPGRLPDGSFSIVHCLYLTITLTVVPSDILTMLIPRCGALILRPSTV